MPYFLLQLSTIIDQAATVVLWLRASNLSNMTTKLRTDICAAVAEVVQYKLYLNVSGTLLAASSART